MKRTNNYFLIHVCFILLLININAWAGNGWKDVSGGFNSVIALKSDGRVFTSGNNVYGQLGDGTNGWSYTFKLVATDVVDVAAYADDSVATGSHVRTGISVILKSDGTVWKTNNSGAWVKTLSGISSLDEHIGGINAIKTDSSVWDAISGLQVSVSSSPVIAYAKGENTLISVGTNGYFDGLPNLRKVALGSNFSPSYFALNDNAQLWVKGDNPRGVHGTGTTSVTAAWTNILTGVKDISSIAQRNSWFPNGAIRTTGSFAVMQDGRLLAAGPKALHEGSYIQSNYISWTEVNNNVSLAKFGTNGSDCGFGVLIKTDGSMWATGCNDNGQFGIGSTASKSVWTKIGDTPPGKVTGVSATDGIQYEKVTINWTQDLDATQYDVFRSAQFGTKGSVIASNLATTSFEDTTVSGDTHYFYTVVAKNTLGSGADSEQNEGYAKTPAIVTSVIATQGTLTGRIGLTWTGNQDATSYEVWRSTANGTSSKIATLPSTETGMDDVSVNGVSSYFYTVKMVVGTLTGSASNAVEGWANGPLTSATVNLVTGSMTPSSATGITVTDPNVSAGKTEAYTFAITSQPTYGTVTLVGNNAVYTPPVDGQFSGALTFEFSASDKGGAVIAGTGNIIVSCDTPNIGTFILPSASVIQASPFYANAVFSLPACSKNGQIKLDILDNNGQIITPGPYVPKSNGTGLTHQFSSNGLVSPGTYNVRMTATSDSGIVTKTAVMTVKEANMPLLNVMPGLSVTVGKELVTASLSNPAVVNCPFTSDPVIAQHDSSKCYVRFTSWPDSMTTDNSGTLPTLSGVFNGAGSFPITAEVLKYDGTLLTKIGELTKTVVASCTAPTVSGLTIPALLSYEIPTYTAAYSAYSCNGNLTGTLVVSKGSTIVDTVSLSDIGYGTNATFTKKGVGLPDGNYIAKLTITGSSGTSSKSQNFTVKATPMPTLVVLPMTVAQGEMKVEATLLPSTDMSCPLTVDIEQAKVNSNLCYASLSTNAPNMVLSVINGLPNLAGYPATSGDFTVNAFISRWVGGVRYDSDPLTKAVKVTPVAEPSFMLSGKQDFFIGIEKASLIFKQDSGTPCNLYDDQATAHAEAIKGKRACYATFTGLTDLKASLSLNQYLFEGTITSPGPQVLSYVVNRIFPDGIVTPFHTGAFPISVKNMPPPTVTLKGGYKITEGKYYVPLGQAITRATVTAGINTNAKMIISIVDSRQSTERKGVMNEGSYWLSTPDLGILEERPVTVRVAWEEFPSIYNEQVITAVGGVENNMKLVLDSPVQIPDTQNIPVKVKIGKYTKNGINYNPQTMGQWRVQIFAQNNSESNKAPVTEMIEMVNGEANFEISPVGNLFLKLTAVAELVSNVEGLSNTLTSSTRFVDIVKGSPIEGYITAKSLDAPAPKTFTLNLGMTLDNRLALKQIQWQESNDNGDTWIDQKSDTIRHTVSMQEPGKRKVRAKMVNKNTLLESYTEPVEVWAYAKLDAEIAGPRHVAPGYTATLKSELYLNGIPTTNTINEWKIDAPSGVRIVTGPVAEVTEPTEGKVTVTLKTRLANTRDDDPNAWSVVRHFLTVKPPRKPSVTGKGTRDVEVGKTYRFEGVAKPSWGLVPSVQTVKSEWETPDGSIVPGNIIDWSPSVTDLLNPKPLVYRAWVDGFKAETTSETELSYAPWEYVWPNFTISIKQLTVQAPSDLLLIVSHDRPDMNRRLEGITYNWDFPSGITGRQNAAFPNRASAQAVYAGEYDITIRVKDERGHETLLQGHVIAADAAPYAVSLKVGKSNLFSRAPMTIAVRATVSGGHPLDSIVKQDWMVDGITISESANKDLMIKDFPTSGSHVISHAMTSKMGKTAITSEPISLVSNTPPECQLYTKPSAYVVFVEAKCNDPDGKVVTYSWGVNGNPVGSTSYRISFPKATIPQTDLVTIKAMDDAGEWSNLSSISLSH